MNEFVTSAECYTTGCIAWIDGKAKLFGNIDDLLRIPREKKKELLNNRTLLDSIIFEGNGKARVVARNNN